jgi:hypothetical protein
MHFLIDNLVSFIETATAGRCAEGVNARRESAQGRGAETPNIAGSGFFTF